MCSEAGAELLGVVRFQLGEKNRLSHGDEQS